ncbi:MULTISPECIES: MFS transporter [Agrobacterium tumefaciens complex]|uniref:MFS transporter n=1 Tax=Agrobacterium tumefaciens TaxID=358 RepID=UPI000FE29050|nr:MFS transporter [Agrobacterium tumefaciens]QAA98970.1 MFS transporter [Agrobacterium tumefaciens]QAB01181.1 MFS transporter [Agrobacterium tumefaciens]
MASSATQNAQTVDIGATLDDGPWGAMQKGVVALAALSIVADGFDGQLIGFAIPSLINEWGVTKADFAPVVAAGLVGMGIGSAIGGMVADRIGRRPAVIMSVLLFSIATCLIGFSHNLWMVALLRFVAGLGIGGALPASTTMAAEYTPSHSRTFAISVTIVCVPLGGMLAGLFASFILPIFGWRALFWIGGLLTLALSGLLFWKLPESPRFLAHQPTRWNELTALLARMSRPVKAGTVFIDSRESAVRQKAGLSAIFEDRRAHDTIALWVACFACLLAVYSAFSWMPTMLVGEGLSQAAASMGLTAYNLGGVGGALICAVAISRYGSRWPLAIFSAGGALSAFLLAGFDLGGNANLAIFGIGIHGFFVTTVQCIIYSLCANIYPTNIRGTGTAATVVVGRVGAIISAFAGAAIITAGGSHGYFILLGASMLAVFWALWVVRNHITSNKARVSTTTVDATT